MNCPQCNAPSIVLKKLWRPRFKCWWRRRACGSGHRFTTYQADGPERLSCPDHPQTVK